MDEFLELLTSQEALIVYMVIGIASILCLIIYIVDKHAVKARQKHNTKELNKLVEEIQEESIATEKVNYEKPVLSPIEKDDDLTTVDEMLQITAALYKEPILEKEEIIEEVPEIVESTPLVMEETPEIIESTPVVMEERKEDALETLEYTAIEPSKEEAKKEIEELTEELKNEQDINKDTITAFEEEQEQTAIISLQELVAKSREMYAANELTQYEDEGNVPISLGELEQKMGRDATPLEDTFSLENIVSKEKEEKEDEKKFKSSPIISPVYGIEKQTDITLENTANYEKFDKELQKSNEFLMTLKELQENIE